MVSFPILKYKGAYHRIMVIPISIIQPSIWFPLTRNFSSIFCNWNCFFRQQYDHTMKIFAMVSYVNWILWILLSHFQFFFNFVRWRRWRIRWHRLGWQNYRQQRWQRMKLVTTRMLNSVDNMNWNILVDYIIKIIVSYGSFTFIIVPGRSPPFPNTFFSHRLLGLKKTKFIRFWWGLTEFVLGFCSKLNL